MSLSSIYGTGKRCLSFELFPPNTPQGEVTLFRHVEQLVACRPGFITCTYGAGGSTRRQTLDIVIRVKRQFNLPVASHLTCVGSTAAQLREYLSQARQLGVEYIVALRGDPPEGESVFQAPVGGLQHANELVALIKSHYPQFGVAVAGYPETHREAPDPQVDLEHLKRKVDAGADLVITQLFYRNEDFLRFRDRCAAIGIRVPVVPGILPVTSLSQIRRISSMCGATLPPAFVSRLAERDDRSWQFQVGVEFATRQVHGLVAQGVPGIHFYVLNRSQAALAVLRAVEDL